jgi:hypothetical protein
MHAIRARVCGVSENLRTGCLERELQTVQLSTTRCSCIATLWVSVVSFAAITLWTGQQRVTPKVSVHFFIDSVRKLLDSHSYAYVYYIHTYIHTYITCVCVCVCTYTYLILYIYTHNAANNDIHFLLQWKDPHLKKIKVLIRPLKIGSLMERSLCHYENLKYVTIRSDDEVRLLRFLWQ